MKSTKSRTIWLFFVAPLALVAFYFVAEGGWAYSSARYERELPDSAWKVSAVVFAPSIYFDRCVDRDPRRYHRIPVLRSILIGREQYLTWCAVQSGAPRCGYPESTQMHE